MSDKGGLRKRREFFVQIPSETIRDRRLSYRARGLLSFLLDMPDGWDVKSEFLASQTDGEGREAIRTALHELGSAGYYRLERRRLRTGRFVMGTAVSSTPDPEWAADYLAEGGKAVVMVEQEDGSFKIKRADGTLADDGFKTPIEAEDVGHDDASSQVEPETGFRAPVSPSPGDPASGEPGSGQRDAISSTHTNDKDVVRDASATPQHPAGSPVVEALSGQPGLPLDGVPSAPDTKGVNATQALGDAAPANGVDVAHDVATAYYEWFQGKIGPVIARGKSSPFVMIRDSLVKPALRGGYTRDEIALALATEAERTNRFCGSWGQFEARLVEVRTGRQAQGNRPAPANRHQDTDPATAAHAARVEQAWGATA